MHPSSPTAPDLPARSLPRDEMARQHAVLSADAPLRLAVSVFAMALSVIFLPWQIPFLCAVVNFAAEAVILRLMRDHDLAARRGPYAACLLAGFASDVAFVLPPVLIFHLDDPFAMAFAVGMVMASVMHVVSTRAVHLPFALVGLMGTGVAVLLSNTIFWMLRDEAMPLVVSTVAGIATLVYAASAAIHTHQLHRDAARGQAEARAADAAKGRFLAQMSHELRTPLNAILGLGHAELARVTDPLSRERLSVVTTAAEGLRTMLDDILDTAMAQAGRMVLRPRRAGPVAEVSGTVALFRPAIEASGLALRLSVLPGLPCVASFDPQRMRQCLSNLLSNAAKHTRAGTITVTVGPDPIEARTLRVTVADTGPGIPTADRARIFEPFGGAGGTGATGRGLGLSISRQLARQMGGDLRLSAPDGDGDRDRATGAVFHLTLALGAVVDARPLTAARPVDAGLPRRVLVVDDVATNRFVAVAHLTLLGFQAEEAASGPDALVRIATGPVPDLILLDMNMPGMDGPEMLARLRGLGGAKAAVPVVAMTADGSLSDLHGMDGYLPKPFSPDQMAMELDRLLRPADAA